MKALGKTIWRSLCVFHGWAGVLIVLGVFSSCTGLKFLEEEEKLYTGANIHMDPREDFSDPRPVERELQRVLRPVPNRKLIWSRPWLWMHQVAGEPTGTGLRHWMKNRLGEEPVLYEDVSLDRNLRLLQNRLHNMGYFDSSIEFRLVEGNRTAYADYHVELAPPYVLGRLKPTGGDSALEKALDASLNETLLTEGIPYSLDLLREERRRMDKLLKQQGFYFFHPDHILFEADTTTLQRRVDMRITLKPDIPSNARKPFRIGRIEMFADYMAAPGLATEGNKELVPLGEGMFFRDMQDQFRPEVIDGSVFMRPDSLYDVRDHDQTLSRLMELGVFQFVNIRFSPGEQEGILNARVLLTPMRRRSLSLELKGVTKSNNFAGPGLEMSLTNHNLRKGAESFKLGFNVSHEVLLGGQRSASATEFGVDASLSLPRFAWPLSRVPSEGARSPRTHLSAGVQFFGRSDAFSLTSLRSQYGYGWRRSATTEFRLIPLVFYLNFLGNVDASIEDLLTRQTLVRQGLFEQFVLGGQYSWIFNQGLLGNPGRSHWYIQANLDVSGNLAYLLMRGSGSTPNVDGSFGLFNQTFAQYSKLDVDVRHYYNLGSGGRRLVGRIYLGGGFPYGNASMLPYVKQFVIGGSSSVRAFHPRALGPGTFSPEEGESEGFQLFRTGDLKLEANLEYRFTISGMFKGAVFADAGNIWRLKEDERVPGGRFDRTTFLGEIALGVGTGLRIDAGFFLLRFDVAVPLADPATNSGGYLDSVLLFDRNWRRDHLMFNLGIGYPF